MREVAFQKWEATGNDFLFIEEKSQSLIADSLPIDAIKKACHREDGFGADGIILYSSENDHPVGMTVVNSDGSRGGMCGNALRCLGRILTERTSRKEHKVKLAGREVEIHSLEGDDVSVMMGPAGALNDRPILSSLTDLDLIAKSQGYLLSFGNPHYVFPVDQIPSNWQEIGRSLQTPADNLLGTGGINCGFVERRPRPDGTHLLRVFERGAGATQSCGSGACAASAVLEHIQGNKPPHKLILPGGTLTIGRYAEGFILTGPARREYIGKWGLHL